MERKAEKMENFEINKYEINFEIKLKIILKNR